MATYILLASFTDQGIRKISRSATTVVIYGDIVQQTGADPPASP